MPRQISRSKRPARRSAGSIESGRFVAPITSTCASGFAFRSAQKELKSVKSAQFPEQCVSVHIKKLKKLGITEFQEQMQSHHARLLFLVGVIVRFIACRMNLCWC